MDMTASAEDRAVECERRIREVVDSGRFVLGGGYQHTLYSDANWCKAARAAHVPESECGGCALGSLAFALANRSTITHTSEVLRVEVAESGIASRYEVFQLEMGYEGWGMIDIDAEPVYANRNSPFYKLGEKLRGVAACMLAERRKRG